MTTRIAVAGAGLIGKDHVRRLLESPTCELASIVDPAPSCADYARELGVPHYADLEEMVAQDRPDGVVLATPNQLHLPSALKCMQARLPMLLEKPVADSLEASEEVLAAAENQNAVLLVGHHRTHSPIMRLAADTIRSGTLGQVVAVNATALFYKPDDYFDVAWRREPGGGPVLLNLIHEIHNLRILCGELSVPTMRLTRYADGSTASWCSPMEQRTVDLVREDPLTVQMEHFGAVVRGEAAPLCTIRDGAMNVRVVEAIQQSARTGRRVDVADVAPHLQEEQHGRPARQRPQPQRAGNPQARGVRPHDPRRRRGEHAGPGGGTRAVA